MRVPRSAPVHESPEPAPAERLLLRRVSDEQWPERLSFEEPGPGDISVRAAVDHGVVDVVVRGAANAVEAVRTVRLWSLVAGWRVRSARVLEAA